MNEDLTLNMTINKEEILNIIESQIRERLSNYEIERIIRNSLERIIHEITEKEIIKILNKVIDKGIIPLDYSGRSLGEAKKLDEVLFEKINNCLEEEVNEQDGTPYRAGTYGKKTTRLEYLLKKVTTGEVTKLLSDTIKIVQMEAKKKLQEDAKTYVSNLLTKGTTI